ncbi:MAG: hypothetical protein KAY06_06175, partial [Aeromonadaceae bacterium]|nr:hypothetical protein [Aeromonadaceae bacterium]
ATSCPRRTKLMSLWIWIALPLLFLLGLFINSIKEMKNLEKTLPKYKEKLRPVEEDEDEAVWRKAREKFHAKQASEKHNKIK